MLLKKANNLEEAKIQQIQNEKEMTPPQNLTEEEKEQMMAYELSQTMKILKAQEDRQKQNKNKPLGHDLFLTS